MKKNILLISYTFPPYPGIGGRRWAKFAKYLSRLDYTVHVVHAKNPFKETSLWFSDIENNPNIKRYELNNLYPTVLLTEPRSIFEKIKYKIALLKNNFLAKGNPYDKAIFWKKTMLKKCDELITEHKIKNVIVSCAPFTTAYYAISLKKKFKDLNLIVDFRDPWTWGNRYGYENLSTSKKKFEKMMEKSVIANADIIYVPIENMLNHLEKEYSLSKEKIALLPHCYDEDELCVLPKTKNNAVRFILYGSLYDNIGHYFEEICKAIANNPNKIYIDIYSDSLRHQDIIIKHKVSEYVKYYSSLPAKELFQKMNKYDFALLIYPTYAKDLLSTKIYEIIYSETPIFYIGEQASTSDFIQKNNIGIFSTIDEIEKNLDQVLEKNFKPNFEDFKDTLRNYSFANITEKMIKRFN